MGHPCKNTTNLTPGPSTVPKLSMECILPGVGVLSCVDVGIIILLLIKAVICSCSYYSTTGPAGNRLFGGFSVQGLSVLLTIIITALHGTYGK